MSDSRVCGACGLTFNTGWGSDQQHCSHCDDGTSYAPEGVTDVEVGDHVSHLYFTGQVTAIRGRTLDGNPASVEVYVKQSEKGSIPERVTLDTSYLDSA